MGPVKFARFPHGRVTAAPRVKDYQQAINFLQLELHVARSEGLTMKAIRLQADIAAYRHCLRRIIWRQATTTPRL